MALFTKKRKYRTSIWSYRWLYLMRRTPFSAPRLFRIFFVGIHWILPIFWGGRYKIGVSNDLFIRRRDIDKDLPGGIMVVFAVPVLRVQEKESRLHRKFKANRYRPTHAGKSAGKSEHFRLDILEVLSTKLIMIFFFLQSNLVGLILLTFISYVVYSYVASTKGVG